MARVVRGDGDGEGTASRVPAPDLGLHTAEAFLKSYIHIAHINNQHYLNSILPRVGSREGEHAGGITRRHLNIV